MVQTQISDREVFIKKANEIGSVARLRTTTVIPVFDTKDTVRLCPAVQIHYTLNVIKRDERVEWTQRRHILDEFWTFVETFIAHPQTQLVDLSTALEFEPHVTVHSEQRSGSF